MKQSIRIATGVLAIVAAGAVGAAALAWKPEIAPRDPEPRASFDPELVRHGAELAALGDCNTCHTHPNGDAFAGGLPIPTPFGTIYSNNITPDSETGIGRWSEAAFQRAMREGVDREGRQLYPAFPYDHFTAVSDDDNRALYAFLMTRQPVHALAPANDLPFPVNIRPVIAGWKLLFLDKGPYKPDPAHDAMWNRGAYLVQGIGHCGACHTPRNMLGAEIAHEFFGGGEAEGWRAFTINAASDSPIPWDTDSLNAYLRQGWHGLHGVARGPMAPVADNLATASDQDVKAIATYVAFVMGKPSPERQQQGKDLLATAKPSGTGTKPQSGGSQTVPPPTSGDAGPAIYASACATCHDSGRPVPYGGINLAFSTVINAESSRNLLNLLLAGLPAADGVRGPIMPGFAATLNDPQITALAEYVRTKFTKKSGWPDIAAQLREARNSQLASNVSTGMRKSPATPSKQDQP